MYRVLESLPGCLLCGEAKPLLKSHVILNFFRKWAAKQTGVQPQFQNPYTRVARYHDDLSKHRLCCAQCESLLSRDESVARRHMLVEWKRDDLVVPTYGQWLARFAAGIAAKAAGVILHSGATTKTSADLELPFNQLGEERVPEEQRRQIASALETWRQFVLGKRTHPVEHELHLLEVDLQAFPGLRGVYGHNPLRAPGFGALLVLLDGIAFLAVTKLNRKYARRDTRIEVRQ